jgi:acyl-CoA thioesterase-1
MKRIYLILAALALLSVGGIIIFQTKHPSYPVPSVGKNVIIFGDSLAYGQGSSEEHDLASILGTRLGLPTINEGVNGDTTVSAQRRVDTLADKDPKVVVILLGGNDFFQNIPADTTMSALTSIVNTLQRSGTGIILVNEDKIFATTPLFAKLAEEKNIPYIENAMGGILNHKELMSDQIHPNDAGYEIMANKIEPVLKSYLHL